MFENTFWFGLLFHLSVEQSDLNDLYLFTLPT